MHLEKNSTFVLKFFSRLLCPDISDTRHMSDRSEDALKRFSVPYLLGKAHIANVTTQPHERDNAMQTYTSRLIPTETHVDGCERARMGHYGPCRQTRTYPTESGMVVETTATFSTGLKVVDVRVYPHKAA